MVPICAFVFFLSQVFGLGETLSPPEQHRYENQFTQSQKSLKTFSANLTQSLQLSGMKKPVISQGKLFFQNPQGWLLIDYTQPTGEFVLLHDPELFIKKRGKPLKKQNLKDEGKNSFTMLRRFFQEGASAWKEDFNVSMIKNDSQLVILLTPKKTDRTQPQEIQTRVDLKTFLPQELQLSFEGDNHLIYQFSNVQRNNTLSPKLFATPSL